MIMTMSRVAELLMSEDNYLILTHRRPDGDTIGSGAALCRLLRACGKTAYLHNNEDFTAKYEFLYDGLTAPEGFEPAKIVTVDIADTALLPTSAEHLAGDVFLCIDHHSSNTNYAQNSYVDSGCCAVGEILFALINELGGELTQEIATAIYVAISTDTGCFRYANTTANCHIIAAACIEKDIECYWLNKMLFETKTRARFNVERFVFEHLQILCDGKVAIVAITIDDTKRFDANQDDLENLSNIPRQIEGVECAVIMTQTDSENYKVSVRTSDLLNASEICAQFGGGGHKNAAGCTLRMSADEAVAKIEQTVSKALGECVAD